MAVVFPRPPPTHNTLTTSQRTQLLRSNAKLGQVLGSTPFILDDVRSKCYFLTGAPFMLTFVHRDSASSCPLSNSQTEGFKVQVSSSGELPPYEPQLNRFHVVVLMHELKYRAIVFRLRVFEHPCL